MPVPGATIQQYRSQARLAELEEYRRQDELRPDIRVRYLGGDGDDALEFVNQGPVNLQEVDYALLPSAAGRMPLEGIDEGSLGSLAIGESSLRFVRRTVESL